MRRICTKPLYGLILTVFIAQFACKPTQQAATANPQKTPAAIAAPQIDLSGEYYPDEIQGSDMYLVISKKPADSLNYKVLWASNTKQIKQAAGLGLQYKNKLVLVRGTNPVVAYLTQQQNQWVSHVVQGNSDLVPQGMVLPKGLPALGATSSATDIDFRLKLTKAGDVLLTGQIQVTANGGDLLYLKLTPINKDYVPFKGMAYMMDDGGYILVWNMPEMDAAISNSGPLLSFAAYDFKPVGKKLEAKGLGAEYGDSNAMPVGLQPK